MSGRIDSDVLIKFSLCSDGDESQEGQPSIRKIGPMNSINATPTARKISARRMISGRAARHGDQDRALDEIGNSRMEVSRNV
ncbi:hypothetical protein [Pararhizobium sp. PWRC1-1]|uniref:hypothetical protein n=1 Tax=Pararhizobium sp. PWRC1-1 TaxID=2804566 RepID=UPI003CF37186